MPADVEVDAAPLEARGIDDIHERQIGAARFQDLLERLQPIVEPRSARSGDVYTVR